MFIVTVKFAVVADKLDGFLPQMLQNARLSLTDEPGCLQFDVCQSVSAPTDVFLYEVYADAAAFDAHKATEHFRAFDTATADMVTSKSVETFERIEATG